MPTFQYTARDREGNMQSGLLAAENAAELREVLRNRDLYLTKSQLRRGRVAEEASGGQSIFGQKKVKLGDMVVMSRQLATLVRSGLTIIEALSAVAAQTENPTLVDALNMVRLDVLTGQSLGSAMRKHPKVFNEIYVSLVEAGEAAGTLDHTLELAATQFDEEAELREQIKAALTYPAIVVVAACGVVAFMLVFVVPAFAKVYQQFHAQLPAVTRMLITLSDIVLHRAWVVILAAILLIFGFRRYIETESGRLRYDSLKLKLPLLGKLIRKIAIARFAQTWAGATKGGMPILQALQISANTSGNVVIRNSVQQVATFVKEGATLADPLSATGQFPPMVTRMIAAGESSGDLDMMLEELARFYRRDIDYQVKKLTRLMEPIMTVVVGAVVLFVLVALYMPIFTLPTIVRR
ncbi:MAG TPA: type II secretion system F family protein [Fimbriimonadales bacterium]|nr:type II secretion system F family protein [Fimbriimonadales bacterium]